jgi:hypothetical protein
VREEIDLRIPERNARGRLPDDVGERLGENVRRIQVAMSDPLVEHLRRLDREFRARGDVFFTGWRIHRHYSRRELEDAELLHVWAKTMFEPAGEECGTVYDETEVCDHVFAPESEIDVAGRRVLIPASTCGAGARQVTPLHLDARRIPRNVDFAETIAGERIVSQRLAECLTDGGLQGFTLPRVLHKARYQDDPVDLHDVPSGRELLKRADDAGAPHPGWSFWVWANRTENRAMLEKAMAEYAAQKGAREMHRGRSLPVWYQLIVNSASVDLSPLTRAGESPFDDASGGRCSRGHIIGLNLLSEVTVRRASLPDADVMETKQMIGVRRGLLRPRPVLLLSSKTWRAIESARIKGFTIEVAHAS